MTKRKLLAALLGTAMVLLLLSGCPSPFDEDDDVAAETFGVTYDPNGGDGGSVPSDEGQYATGDQVTVMGNPNGLTRSGYTFTGWSTSQGGSTRVYTEGETFLMDSAPVTLYAQWLEQQNLAAPTFSPAPGEYGSAQDVSISADAGATVYYTLDGTTPDSSSNQYDGAAITITETTTIRAIAVASNKPDSNVAEGTYTILDPQSDPTFSPDPNVSYTEATDITISADTGATIFYTLTVDGTTSPEVEYTGPFTIDEDGQTIIDARAEKDGAVDATAQAIYTLNLPTADKPVIGPDAAEVEPHRNTDTTVTITTGTGGASIYYTTDPDNDDKDSWSEWSPGDLVLSAEGSYTIRAFAGGDGFADSFTEEHTIVIDKTAPSFVAGKPTVQEITADEITFSQDVVEVTDGPLYSTYYVAVPDGDPAPTASQVIDGTNASDGTPAAEGLIGPSAPNESVEGMTDGDYDWYLVPEDKAGNTGDTAVKVDAVRGQLDGTVDVTPGSVTVQESSGQAYALTFTPSRTDLFVYSGVTANLSSLGGDTAAPLTENDGTWSLTYTDTDGRTAEGTYNITVTYEGTDIHDNPVESGSQTTGVIVEN